MRSIGGRDAGSGASLLSGVLSALVVLAGCDDVAGPDRPRFEQTAITPSETFFLAQGARRDLMLSGYTSEGEFEDDITGADWRSSNTTVAIVNDSGVVTAVGVGEAVITAVAGDSAFAYVTVLGPVLAFRSDAWLAEGIGFADSDGNVLGTLYDAGPYRYYAPRWSPDGLSLAMVRSHIDADTADDLVVWSLITDSLRVVLPGVTWFTHSHRWSPDGTRIAISSGEIVSLIGAPPVHLPATGYPSWSADGMALVFSGAGAIVKVASAGGVPDTLSIWDGFWQPYSVDAVWHPVADLIAFASEGPEFDFGRAHIYTMRGDGSQKQLVAGDSTVRLGHPSWSPDGDRFSFIRYVAYNRGELVTIGGIYEGCPIRWDSFAAWPYEWSADGSRVAYVDDVTGNLVIANPLTCATSPVAAGLNPTWRANPFAARTD